MNSIVRKRCSEAAGPIQRSRLHSSHAPRPLAGADTWSASTCASEPRSLPARYSNPASTRVAFVGGNRVHSPGRNGGCSMRHRRGVMQPLSVRRAMRVVARDTGPAPPARRALVVCAHLRPGRDKRRTRYFMQPISGLHVGSLIDPRHFDVRLHHEDWHGPLDPARCEGYDLVFLSGLQPDFDRMRQLSYFFRRSGATVVAGGSICTSFPEFATRFFDVVCAGGVDSVREVVADYLRGIAQADLPIAGRPHLVLCDRPRPAREERHQSAVPPDGDLRAAAASSATSASSRPKSAPMRATTSRPSPPASTMRSPPARCSAFAAGTR